MEDNFRNALIIISAIIIAAIFIHGLWTIRKNKNPYKLNSKTMKVEPMPLKIDASGFDQDGIGQRKVIKPRALTGEIDNPPADNEIPHQPAPAPDYSEEPLPSDLERKESGEPLSPDQHDVSSESPALNLFNEDLLSTDVSQKHRFDEIESIDDEPVFKNSQKNNEKDDAENEPKLGNMFDIDDDNEAITFGRDDEYEFSLRESAKETAKEAADAAKKAEALKEIEERKARLLKPIYKEPVTQAKPRVAPVPKKVEPAKSTADIKRNQIELDLVDEPKIETEVIVFSVMVPEGYVISGASLLPNLLTLGMKFGEMNIFHRHQDNAGNGKVTFSLANMVNPGTFDLDNMEQFTTQGVSLFMTLPNAGKPFDVFEQMLATAKHLAKEFGGHVLDDKRNIMTKQSEQHYVSKIREFERKSRIAHI